MSKTATIIAVRDEEIRLIPEGASSVNWTPPHAWAGPRPFLETDPTFRQVIPYVIVKRGDKVLTYVRNAEGNESRLHGKASIGVGGHIDAEDASLRADGSIDLELTIRISARREIAEELDASPPRSGLKHIGFLKISETEVDRVHFGYVLLWDLTDWDENSFTFESTMANVRWMTPDELLASDLELETWSALALDLI